MKKTSLFTKIYLSCVAASVVIILIGLTVLWFWLSSYEKSTPQYYANYFYNAIEDKDYKKITNFTDGITNEFETEQQIKEYLEQTLADKTLEVVKNTKKYSAENPSFNILADGNTVLTMTLKRNDKKGSFGFLGWNVSDVEGLKYQYDKIKIFTPDNALVQVNGKDISTNIAAGSKGTIEAFNDIPEGIEKPQFTQVELNNFFEMPQITAKIGDKDAYVLKVSDEEFIVSEQDSNQMKAEYEPMVFELAKMYSNYISADVKFEKLKPYLISKSKLYHRLRTMEVHWFTTHTRFAFENMKSDNYIKYDDNSFSCEVSFDYYIYRDTKEYKYPSKYAFYFVKQNGQYKLGELVIK